MAQTSVSITKAVKATTMRYLALCVAAVLLTDCSHDVVLQNPRTGENTVCPQSFAGWNPWSQTYACATAKAEQGWNVVGSPY
jgi:hypothetical protein